MYTQAAMAMLYGLPMAVGFFAFCIWNGVQAGWLVGEELASGTIGRAFNGDEGQS